MAAATTIRAHGEHVDVPPARGHTTEHGSGLAGENEAYEQGVFSEHQQPDHQEDRPGRGIEDLAEYLQQHGSRAASGELGQRARVRAKPTLGMAAARSV